MGVEILHYTGKPNGKNDLYMKRNASNKEFRKLCRQVLARKDFDEKQRILELRTIDSRSFHRLVNSQRKKGHIFINDLHVGDMQYCGEQNILQDFKNYFEQLAMESTNELYDEDYHKQVAAEVEHISKITSANEVDKVTITELK